MEHVPLGGKVISMEKLRALSDEQLEFFVDIAEEGLKHWTGSKIPDVKKALQMLKDEQSRRKQVA